MPDGAVTAPATPAAAAQTGDTGKDTGKGKGKRGGTKTKVVLLCPSITAVTDLTEPMQAALKEGNVVMIDHTLVRLRRCFGSIRFTSLRALIWLLLP